MPIAFKFFAIFGLLVLATVIRPAATSAQPACKGQDMLPELAKIDPTIQARLAAAASGTVNTEAIFWRIENSRSAPSYLLGTAHVSDERITTLSPRIREAMAAARTMAFEVADLSPEAMAVAVSKSVALFTYSNGRQLDQTLPPDQFRKVASVLAKTGMPPEAAARIKPWLVFLLMAMPECERARHSAGKFAFDQQLTLDARQRGAAVIGLETIESQLAMMAAIPEDQQIAMLKVQLFYADRTEDQLETMLQLYLTRRMGLTVPLQHEFARRAGVEPEAFASFETDIINKRNHGMSAAALPLLAKGGAFISVGALHLIGTDGLVALFRRAGYIVTAVE